MGVGGSNESAAITFLGIWQPKEPLFTTNKVKKRDGVAYGSGLASPEGVWVEPIVQAWGRGGGEAATSAS